MLVASGSGPLGSLRYRVTTLAAPSATRTVSVRVVPVPPFWVPPAGSTRTGCAGAGGGVFLMANFSVTGFAALPYLSVALSTTVWLPSGNDFFARAATLVSGMLNTPLLSRYGRMLTVAEPSSVIV